MFDRRTFLGVTAAAVAAAKLGLNNTFPAETPEPVRPNIVLITTDQQSAEAASFRIGTKYLNTPSIDSLAKSGTSFTRAYCANPICVPSRTAIFTGRYPTTTGVMDNEERTTVKLDAAKAPMMGRVFADGGYETAYFGKWHLPCDEKEREQHGFVTLNTKANDDVLAAANAVNFLKSKHERPFLLVTSLLNPHNICEWARGQALPLGDLPAPPPPEQCPPERANHDPQARQPEIMALMEESYHASPMFPVGGFDAAKWRQYLWAYYRLIERSDALIGQVLQALRDSGLDRNTVVVFTADHGDCQGSHGWNQKTVLYEESVGVPLVISRAGARMATSNRLVNTGIDILPTLCDYAGIAAPKGLPGLSLKPSVEHDPRRYIVVSNKMNQGAEVGGRVPRPEGRMLRAQRYKYCAYSEGEHRESLVDLEMDPGEMVNLAGELKYRATLNEHRAMLAEWCKQNGDAFDVPKVA